MRLSKLHDILIDPYSLHLTPIPQSYINIISTQYGQDREQLLQQQLELREQRIQLLTQQQKAEPYPIKILSRLSTTDPNAAAQFSTTNPDSLAVYEQYYLHMKRRMLEAQQMPFSPTLSHPDPVVDVVGLLLNGTKLALQDVDSADHLDLSNPFQPSLGGFAVNKYNNNHNNVRTDIALLGINGIPMTDYIGALSQELNHINLALPINGKALELHAELSVFLELLVTIQDEVKSTQIKLDGLTTERLAMEEHLKVVEADPTSFHLTIPQEQHQTDPITQQPTVITVNISPFQQAFDQLAEKKLQCDYIQ